jgi:hypothetical protein
MHEGKMCVEEVLCTYIHTYAYGDMVECQPTECQPANRPNANRLNANFFNVTRPNANRTNVTWLG